MLRGVIRSRLRAFVPVLVGLVFLGAAMHAEAHLHVLLRAAVVSWDSPATQIHDETALQGALYLDPDEEALQALVPPPSSSRQAPASNLPPASNTVRSQLTRSPPLQ